MLSQTGQLHKKHKLWVNLTLVKMARRRAPKMKDIDFEEESDQDSTDEGESEQAASENWEAESCQEMSCDEEGAELESDISQEAKPELRKNSKQEMQMLNMTKDVCSLCGDPLNGERYHGQCIHRRCSLSHRSLKNRLKGERKVALKSIQNNKPEQFTGLLACVEGDNDGQKRGGGNIFGST